jgi:hypothetical protein
MERFRPKSALRVQMQYELRHAAVLVIGKFCHDSILRTIGAAIANEQVLSNFRISDITIDLWLLPKTSHGNSRSR